MAPTLIWPNVGYGKNGYAVLLQFFHLLWLLAIKPLVSPYATYHKTLNQLNYVNWLLIIIIHIQTIDIINAVDLFEF